MKKILLVLAILTVISIAGSYLFIPRVQTITASITFRGNATVTNRVLGSMDTWMGAIKGAEKDSSGGIVLNGRHYKVLRSLIGQLAVGIKDPGSDLLSTMVIIPIGHDSVDVHWITTLPGSNNPLKRVKYLSTRNLLEAEQMRILFDISQFLQQSKNVYGFEMVRGLMTDSILLTTIVVSPQRPALAEIYQQIEGLQAYASKHQAEAINSPMMSVQPNREGPGYRTQIALPINKRIPERSPYAIKRMVLGNNLSTLVTGPTQLIDSAFRSMYHYIADFALTMPAIPYELLITDRRKEPDSTQWQTRVVFPIY